MIEHIEKKWITREEFKKIKKSEPLRQNLVRTLKDALCRVADDGTALSGRTKILNKLWDESERKRLKFKMEDGRLTEVLAVSPKAMYEPAIATFEAINSFLGVEAGLTRDDIIGRNYLGSEIIFEYMNDGETNNFLKSPVTGAYETYGLKGHVGKIIEVKRFFSFSDLLSTKSGGTPPEECLIRRTPGSTTDWASSHLGDRKGDLTKYKLSDYRPRTLDEGGNLKELHFKSYKHLEYKEYLDRGLLKDPQKRIEMGHADPLLNKIPNPFGVHAIIAFNDMKTFLCLQRRSSLAYEAGTISFGCEEQLDNSDFFRESAANLDNLVNRLILEEVFPAAYIEQNTAEGRNILENTVEFKKVLSLMYAENYCCHNAVAFIKLKLDAQQYTTYFKEILQLGEDGLKRPLEDEGLRLCMSMEEVNRFLATGRGTLKSPFGRRMVDLVIDRLIDNQNEAEFRPHVSTVYRMKIVRELLG
ncbi:hypothetical protein [Rhizobium sp. BR 314]|uniref:hypothetical protein n=1 Tax=Rhizobium sp. BR 314 TaxID=3040013 RepID=UPI0039BFAC9B